MAIDWTSDRVNALLALWNEGVTTAEIGRRLGITKNAVVGKTHRLGLSRRPSAAASPVSKASQPSASSAMPAAPRRPEPPPLPQGEIVRLEKLASGMCSWPEGEPGTENFRFCGHPAAPGKPYCEAHCARAYVKVTRDRDKIEAA